MENDATRTSTTNWLVLAFSVIWTMSWMIFLLSLDRYKSLHNLTFDTSWMVMMRSVASFLVGTGALGVIFEIFVRRAFVRETQDQLHKFFDEDPKFAASLKIGKQKVRIENALKAHLGDDLGNALFSGLVSRYFSIKDGQGKKIPLRRDAQFNVRLSPCNTDQVFLANNLGFELDPKLYFHLNADYSFEGIFQIMAMFKWCANWEMNQPISSEFYQFLISLQER